MVDNMPRPSGMASSKGTLGETHRVDLGPASTLLPCGCEIPEGHLADKNFEDILAIIGISNHLDLESNMNGDIFAIAC